MSKRSSYKFTKQRIYFGRKWSQDTRRFRHESPPRFYRDIAWRNEQFFKGETKPAFGVAHIYMSFML